MGESCSVTVVSSDGVHQLVEDSCNGESRLEPVPQGPTPPPVVKTAIHSFSASPTPEEKRLIAPNTHFNQPGVTKALCTYDPSLNQTLDPDIVDAQQLSDMARQKNSCDPLQKEVAEETFFAAICRHFDKIGQVLDEIVEEIIPTVPEVRDGLLALLQDLPKESPQLPPNYKTILVSLAADIKDPEIKTAVLGVAKQVTLSSTSPSSSSTTTSTSETGLSGTTGKVMKSPTTDRRDAEKPVSYGPQHLFHEPLHIEGVPPALDGTRDNPVEKGRVRPKRSDIPGRRATTHTDGTILQISASPDTIQDLQIATEDPSLLAPTIPEGLEILSFLEPLESTPEIRDQVFGTLVTALHQALVSPEAIPPVTRSDRVDTPESATPAHTQPFLITLTYRPESSSIEVRITPVSREEDTVANQSDNLARPLIDHSDTESAPEPSRPARNISVSNHRFGGLTWFTQDPEKDPTLVVFVPVPLSLFQKTTDRLELTAPQFVTRGDSREGHLTKVDNNNNPSDHQDRDGDSDSERGGGGHRDRGGQDGRQQGDQEGNQQRRRSKKSPSTPEAYA